MTPAVRRLAGLCLPGAAGRRSRRTFPVRGVSVSDVVFVVLTVALFAVLALVVRAVEKL
ncbi:hypothetical protein [Micromonospora tarensis]|uniref:K+-transporting ATPase, KdpF subunit n=1 Tax=Micromonospora tarensis TaxID=2806100 RepID=A0ABS1YB77_9ACTN|nr:hypothetical protein [Micromonospora tarensis]MBM0274622.1 hypothetical protein [Micromonospora tarensis]